MTTIFWHLAAEPSDAAVALSPSEAARLAEMRFERRRRSFLLGRLAAKQLLRGQPAYADLPPAAITIANRLSGAPYVQVAGRELVGCLSLSHRDDRAVSAWTSTPGVAVGIDLEIVEPRSAAFGRDYFTPAEADFIAAVAPQEQAAWVTCLWSAKEAVLKALGLGLRLDTRAVQISPRPEAVWEAGWQEMQVSGTAWSAAACRVWRRLEGAAVVTLAVIAPAVDLAKCEVIYAA